MRVGDGALYPRSRLGHPLVMRILSRSAARSAFFVGALAVVGCGGGGPQPDAGSDAPCARPAAPYGIRVGDRMEGFVLPRCDGTMMDLYDGQLCAHRLTVVTISAGWCGSCATQSVQLTREIVEPYRDRGVRVVEVIYEDDEYGPPDAAFCRQWSSMGGVEGVEVVYNPTGVVPPFGVGADARSLPITVIADQSGTIRAVLSGTSEGLSELKQAIDAALAR
ncbi:MAG: hypothetical protein OHK0013_01320 [Sandaracinaceae bacterium]